MLNLGWVTRRPFCSEPFTIHRFAGGAFDNTGVWVKGAEVTIAAQGAIQPAGYGELSSLPEGERSKNHIRIHSTVEIYKNEGETATVNNSDRIEWRGRLFKVVSTQHWGDFGYWEVLAQEVNRG